MFEWIAWLGGIVILAWAFFAGLMALRGSADAGWHEVAHTATEESSIVSQPAPNRRAIGFRAIQALQFLVAIVVTAAGTWLLVQTVT